MKRQYDESGKWFLNGMGKSGFKGATSDKRYVQILKYIGDHDGCTKMDVLQGIGSNKFGRGQYSDMFAALNIAGLIEYDRKNNEYHITEEGEDVLKNSYLNDMERIATGRKKFESAKKFAKESMNLNGVETKLVGDDKILFTRRCPSCGKPNSIILDAQKAEDGLTQYSKGSRIQDAFPDLRPDEREFFMTGICAKCWEEM